LPDGDISETKMLQPLNNFIEPMKALRVRDLPFGNWIYEMKFDGYRALAFKAAAEVRLLSRNRTNFSGDYPNLSIR
jgi:bifunctional non-homologous end joining protein LigD